MDTLDNTRQTIQETEQRICDRQIKRLVVRLPIVAFAWFMLIPENWEILLWPISAPLAWVADSILSIGKMAAVSPMPGAVRGVLASTAIVAPVAGIIILLNDCIGVRVKAFAEGRSFFRIAIAPFVWLFGLALFI